ncbi:MAG TPA: hypothetical protein VN181_14410, partial [Thermoanaerobaculia bacterium]|nr:hypothetical protein [Thermoanaerobaculia bacterium]
MVVLAVSALTAFVRADEIASTHFDIVGVALEVADPNVTTGVDLPAIVRTKFGGLMDDAVPATDMLVVAELTGPGLDAPISLTTRPGRRFTLPPLHEKGDYTLQNVRLVDANGKFVQAEVPSAA